MRAVFRRLVPRSVLLAIVLACVVSGYSHTEGAVEYVALGDSRAAAPDRVVGPGSDGCGRSMNGYPVRLAATIRPRTFIDATCSGATSANLLSTVQDTTSPAGRSHHARPQISALRATTTLVTISIGGNDLNWWNLISSCFPPRYGADAGCRFDRAMRDRVDRKLTELAGWIDADLDAVVARAPGATVVVVGHGGIYGPHGCGPAATVGASDAAWVADFFHRIDEVLRGGAAAHGVRFVDVRGAGVGHDACAPAPSRWFEGNVSTGETPERHPTPVGSRAIAALVVEAIR